MQKILVLSLICVTAVATQTMELNNCGHNAWLLQTTSTDKLHFTNLPSHLENLPSEELRTIVLAPVASISYEGDRQNPDTVTVDCAWMTAIEYAEPRGYLASALITGVPLAAAAALGYLVAKKMHAPE